MNSRERVAQSIEFGQPDHVPLWPRINQTAWQRHGEALAGLLAKYPIDMGLPARMPPEPARVRGPRTWVDDWACTWHTQRTGYFGFVVEHPLADPAALASYRFPDYSAPGQDQRFERQARASQQSAPDTYRRVGGATEYGVLWYRMQWLRGVENAMVDIAEGSHLVIELRDRVLASRLSYLRRILALDADGVVFGDDWGTQTGLMIRPEQWRAIFKPAYKQLFDAVHEAGKHVFLETDGCTTDILADWIEIGVDALSVQLNVVGIDNAARHRGQVCFWSDPDRQEILPNGSPQDVREHIAEIVQALNTPRGGLIGCMWIDDTIPLRNIEAALDTFVECGGAEGGTNAEAQRR